MVPVAWEVPAVAFVVTGLVGTDLPPWFTEVKDLVRAGGRARALAGLGPEDAVRALKRVPDAVRVGSLEELRASATRNATPVPQLTAPELRELESEGIAIGNHSLTHPCLSRCDDDKIRRTRALMTARRSNAFLEVDGGISAKTIARARAAGADTFVAGNAVFGSPDPAKEVKELKRLGHATA